MVSSYSWMRCPRSWTSVDRLLRKICFRLRRDRAETRFIVIRFGCVASALLVMIIIEVGIDKRRHYFVRIRCLARIAHTSRVDGRQCLILVLC